MVTKGNCFAMNFSIEVIPICKVNYVAPRKLCCACSVYIIAVYILRNHSVTEHDGQHQGLNPVIFKSKHNALLASIALHHLSASGMEAYTGHVFYWL